MGGLLCLMSFSDWSIFVLSRSSDRCILDMFSSSDLCTLFEGFSIMIGLIYSEASNVGPEPSGHPYIGNPGMEPGCSVTATDSCAIRGVEACVFEQVLGNCREMDKGATEMWKHRQEDTITGDYHKPTYFEAG